MTATSPPTGEPSNPLVHYLRDPSGTLHQVETNLRHWVISSGPITFVALALLLPLPLLLPLRGIAYRDELVERGLGFGKRAGIPNGAQFGADALADGEAQALLDALDATDYGARCAHGRPVVAEWTLAEIEKRFGRDYASHAHAAPPESL